MSLFKYFPLTWQSIKRYYLQYVSLIIGLALLLISLVASLSLIAGFAQRDHLPKDKFVHIQSGSAAKINAQHQVSDYKLAQTIGSPSILTAQDFQDIRQLAKGAPVAPLTYLNLKPSSLSGQSLQQIQIIVTNEDFLQMMGLEVEQGTNTLSSSGASLVIGHQIAQELFNNNQPLSYEIIIGQEQFLVGGVLKKQAEIFDPLNVVDNYDRVIFIPYQTFVNLQAEAEEPFFIYKILASIAEDEQGSFIASSQRRLSANHTQENFEIYISEADALKQNIYQESLQLIAFVVVSLVAFICLVLTWHHLKIMRVYFKYRQQERVVSHIVGATRNQIMFPIFLENLLLCLLVYVVSGALSVLLVVALGFWTHLVFALYWQIYLYNLIISAGFGLLLGLWSIYLLRKQNFTDYSDLKP